MCDRFVNRIKFEILIEYIDLRPMFILVVIIYMCFIDRSFIDLVEPDIDWQTIL